MDYGNSDRESNGKTLLEKSANLLRNDDEVGWSGRGALSKFGRYPERGAPLPTQASHFGKGPKGYQRSDARIHEEICERLTRDPDVDASEIEVSVQDGEVTLSGSVLDRRQKYWAEDSIEQVHGIRDIHNRLRVQRHDAPILRDPTHDWYQHA